MTNCAPWWHNQWLDCWCCLGFPIKAWQRRLSSRDEPPDLWRVVCWCFPTFPPNSLMVMDNASCHSSRKEPLPTKSCTKMKMMEWLSSDGIFYSEKCLKCQIWEILESNRPQNSIYVIEDTLIHITKSHYVWILVISTYVGHEVVRFPVVHCKLNPIEMVWAQVKGYVRDYNQKKFTLVEVQRVVN